MTYKKTSLGVLGTLLLFKSCSAVQLDSSRTPCAEQALAQIESALSASGKHCLCFQYADMNLGQLSAVDVADVALQASVITRTPIELGIVGLPAPGTPLDVVATIAGGGALISAVGGECVDQYYVVTGVEDRTKCADLLGGAVGDCCALDLTDMLCD